ncbi:MAG: Mur ligase domain-containing protein, partial [Burkholderiales bacterium]
MMSSNLAAKITGGVVRGREVMFDRISTDSRKIRSGDLFVALRGERFDGHLYARAALDGGAAAVMVDSDHAGTTEPAIVVPDTRLALGMLAAHWRKTMHARI